jgi:site-specific DNA-methyltransferase (adenine-specific)
MIPCLTQKFRLVLCDLPYGITACDWDKKIDLVKFWEVVKPILTEDGSVVMFGSQPFTTDLISSNRKMFKYEWIWYKNKGTGHLSAKHRPLRTHESILVFQNKPFYNPQITDGHKPMSNVYAKPSVKEKKDGYDIYNIHKHSEHLDKRTTRLPRSVIEFRVLDNIKKEKTHPTQKPVPLLEYLIKTYTNEGDWVLDPTAGSFSVGVACRNTNRHFVGIEMSETYYNIGCERLGIKQ